MFNRDYLEKLKQYVGKDIQLVESDNEMRLPIYDIEEKKNMQHLENTVVRLLNERWKMSIDLKKR